MQRAPPAPVERSANTQDQFVDYFRLLVAGEGLEPPTYGL